MIALFFMELLKEISASGKNDPPPSLPPCCYGHALELSNVPQ